MSQWGWQPVRSEGIWRYGSRWLRPFTAASSWIAVALIVLQFHIISGSMTVAKGVLFDLPDAGVSEGDATGLVAMVMPDVHKGAMVFFDDARYLLGDADSAASFAAHLKERASAAGAKPLLVLADRRISGGDLMKLAALAKSGGIARVLFSEKRETGLSE